MHLIVTRPEADAPDLTAELEAAGHRVSLAPMLRMTNTEAPLSFDGVQALVVTSRNGLRALAAGAHLAKARALPIFVVGPASAELARELGFQRVVAGTGGARDLPAMIKRALSPDEGALLNLTGETIAFDVAVPLAAAGFTVAREIVYRAEPVQELPESLTQALRAADVDAVVLMSARTARAFATLVAQHGLRAEADGLDYLCLSDAVAEALDGLGRLRLIARAPNRQEVLALVQQMASNPPA